MERYFGYSGSRIIWVGSSKSDGQKVPDELSKLSNQFLIDNFRVKNGELISRLPKNEISKLKIAFVGVHKIQCGISTYSEYLIPEIAKHISDYKIFAENDPSATDEDKVVRCWKRGDSLSNLSRLINEYDPDIVMVQHEYGIFPDAKYWMSFLTSIKYARVYVALHSVYRHKDKSVCEAVIPNIIVHTDAAKNVLKNEKQVNANIHVIPHGCLSPTEQSKLWNIYKTSHTFMQFGFGFEYKGWENSLSACAELKKKYADVFFTGIFSESSFNKAFHNQYYERLQLMIDDLDIRENVSLIRGFQSDTILESFFRLNGCLVLPYVSNGDHQVFAVTGAARVAMRYGIPVITSDVPFFSDLVGICPQVTNPTDLSIEIEKSWNGSANQVKSQNEFLIRNSWSNVAQLYLKAFVDG